MNCFYVYILKCVDGSYYTGHTDNLSYRISQHNQQKNGGYVSTRLPFELVYYELFATRYEALQAEHAIKKWTRRKKEALISKDFNLLSVLAKKKF